MKSLKKRSEIRKGEIVERYIDDRWIVNRKVCHGDPQRSFFWRGRLMPLCTRCSGLYYSMIPGIIISIPLYILLDPSPLVPISVFLITQIPWSVDGVTQFYGLRRSNNYLRLTTGIIGGLGWGSTLGFLIYLSI